MAGDKAGVREDKKDGAVRRERLSENYLWQQCPPAETGVREVQDKI